MPHLELPDLRLHYRCDGLVDAPCLVLGNSLGVTLDMWQPQVGPFAQHFRVLRYDMRGHGASSRSPARFSLADLGSDVLRLLDTLHVERAHFCGLSLGGAVGIWLGAHAPDRIDRLVLCNTAASFGPPEIIDARLATVRRDGMAAIADGVIERWFTPAFRDAQPMTVDHIRESLLATSVDGYVACGEVVRDLDERVHLPDIRAPTLVIGGTFDPAPRPEAARALANAIPGATYAELHAAHLSNLGAADPFNTRVLDFLLARGAAARGD